MSIRTVLLAAAGTTALGVAQAQDQTGYYGSASAGYAWEYGNNDFESDSPGFPTDWDTRLDTSDGLALAWALGKYFENNFRGEMEVSWRLQDIEAMPGERPVGEPDVPGDGRFFAGFPGGGEDMGSVKVTAFMANILKDFPVTDTLTPYIGAGIGVANIGVDVGNLDDVQTPVTVQADAVNGYRISLDDNDLVPAVQLRAGAAYKLTEKLTAELGYRFLQTAEYDLTGMINDAPAEVSGTYRVHESLFTLRYDFGGKTARRAAAATSTRATKTCFDGSVVGVNQPCPELAEDALTPRELRTVVYFGLNSADLTSTAEALLQRRAREANEVELIEVVVTGNTDTAGDRSYNQRLSARRAAVVREALVRYGIDASKVRVVALGETNLARETADGVREPLNRRTEVQFDF